MSPPKRVTTPRCVRTPPEPGGPWVTSGGVGASLIHHKRNSALAQSRSSPPAGGPAGSKSDGEEISRSTGTTDPGGGPAAGGDAGWAVARPAPANKVRSA